MSKNGTYLRQTDRLLWREKGRDSSLEILMERVNESTKRGCRERRRERERKCERTKERERERERERKEERERVRKYYFSSFYLLSHFSLKCNIFSLPPNF